LQQHLFSDVMFTGARVGHMKTTPIQSILHGHNQVPPYFFSCFTQICVTIGKKRLSQLLFHANLINFNNKNLIELHVLPVRDHYYIALGHTGSKSIPVVRTHATVDHTDVFGYGLYFVNTLLIVQYRFLLLFCSQNNTV